MDKNEKIKRYQTLIELHNDGVITTRNLMEELGMDYNAELKRMRDIQNNEIK